MDIETQNSKARSTAYLFYFLALLVMLVTAWFVVEGVQATEPASSARNAKVAAGVLLLILEGAVFSVAGKWIEFSAMLKALGWSIFALQITLMSLAQIAVGTSAGKAAQISTATVQEILAQSDASRQAAKSLLADAEKLRASNNAWVRQTAGDKSTAAAAQTSAGAGAIQQLQQLQAVTMSTPIVEMIGTPGLIALSIALSLILELSGIALMYTAGRLMHRADMNGLPASPALPAASVKQAQAQTDTRSTKEHSPAPAPQQPAFEFGFIPQRKPAHAEGTAQARHDAPASGEMWTAPRREYFLAPTAHPAKPDAEPASAPPAAPARPAEPVTSAPSLAKQAQQEQPAVTRQAASRDAPLPAPTSATAPNPVEEAAASGASKQTHPAPASASKQTHPAPEGASEQTHLNDAAPKAKRSHKASTAVADGKKMDTGTGPHDGYRFRRVQAAIQAKTLVPGLRTIQRAEGGGAPTVRGYLAKMVETRVIKLNADGTYELIAADESQLALVGV